jgi:hypothetical protein
MVSTARSIILLVSLLSVSAIALAVKPGAVSGGGPVVHNWQAPPFWSRVESLRAGGDRSHALGVEDATAGAFPFIPISPCRQYDSRTIDPADLAQYGLIAEEVAEIYPDLVVCDWNGSPQTVRYQLVNALLLNEVQKQHRMI